jgi:ferric-chelate reductase
MVVECQTLMDHRLSAAAANRPSPAAAATVLEKLAAIFTATGRKISYPQFTPVRDSFWLKVPPFGMIVLVLVLCYLGFIMALEHIINDVLGAQHYAALGTRAGWLAIAQVPLLVLLTGETKLDWSLHRDVI